jgi:hypothetical protein
VQGDVAFGDPDGLLDRFYEVASGERRAEALESIGHGLMDGEEIDDKISARLRALFEGRLEAVRAGARAEELRGFARWFGSGKFDDSWSLAQLEAVLEVGGPLQPDHLVVERLAALRRDRLPDVVRALELLIETNTRQWFVSGARGEIALILTDALAAGGESENRARDIVNRLVARGHPDFEGLLAR